MNRINTDAFLQALLSFLVISRLLPSAWKSVSIRVHPWFNCFWGVHLIGATPVRQGPKMSIFARNFAPETLKEAME
jgi:hypothetical protein